MSSTTHIRNGIEQIELPSPWAIGNVNVYIVKGEKLTLVDCGVNSEEAWDIFNKQLAFLDLHYTDIEQIVLTHHHSDHVGFLDYFNRLHPVPIYAHKNCQPYLARDRAFTQNGNAFLSTFFQEFGLPQSFIDTLVEKKDWYQELKLSVSFTQFLEEGDTIPGLAEWQVFETKGHAQSHIALYRASDQVLLCGDHIIKHSPAGIFMEPPMPWEQERMKPLFQYIKNVEKCMNIPIVVAYSGHGEPITNVQDILLDTLAKIDKRIEKIKKLVSIEWKYGFELVKEIYGEYYEQGIELFSSDLVSILDVLIDRQEVQVEKREGVLYYKAVDK